MKEMKNKKMGRCRQVCFPVRRRRGDDDDDDYEISFL